MARYTLDSLPERHQAQAAAQLAQKPKLRLEVVVGAIERPISAIPSHATGLSSIPAHIAHPKPAKARKTGKKGKQLVERTRNGGTWTEKEFFTRLRSALRRTYRFWKPAVTALHAARVSAPGPRGRKWLFRCEACGKLFLRKDVQIDHREPVGTLTTLEHLPRFITRMTPEDPKAYQVLCCTGTHASGAEGGCHGAKTQAEREARQEASE